MFTCIDLWVKLLSTQFSASGLKLYLVSFLSNRGWLTQSNVLLWSNAMRDVTRLSSVDLYRVSVSCMRAVLVDRLGR